MKNVDNRDRMFVCEGLVCEVPIEEGGGVDRCLGTSNTGFQSEKAGLYVWYS